MGENLSETATEQGRHPGTGEAILSIVKLNDTEADTLIKALHIDNAREGERPSREHHRVTWLTSYF
jgi:hypothetical protein